jgi:uncharacterized membrane protein
VSCIQGHSTFSRRAQTKLRADLGKQNIYRYKIYFCNTEGIRVKIFQNKNEQTKSSTRHKQTNKQTNKQQQQQQQQQRYEVLLLVKYSIITIILCLRVFSFFFFFCFALLAFLFATEWDHSPWMVLGKIYDLVIQKTIFEG